MLKDFLTLNGVVSAANFVEYGYGQVEPNHLSAQRTGQIYAQLPAASSITKLEQGQFAKYDYAAGVVDFTGKGEWMLVYNEIKLYGDIYGNKQADCEFAMLKDNYQARIYSPFGGDKYSDYPDTTWTKQSRYYNGVDSDGNSSITIGATPDTYVLTTDTEIDSSKTYYTKSGDTYTPVSVPDEDDLATYYEKIPGNPGKTYAYDDVTAPKDIREIYSTEDPFHIEGPYKAAKMPAGTTMVPRLFKTNVGDIFTTNTVKITGTGTSGAVTAADRAGIVVGTTFTPDTDGILKVTTGSTGMLWEVVKNYTMPDHQAGLKLMRIQ